MALDYKLMGERLKKARIQKGYTSRDKELIYQIASIISQKKKRK